jgi:hypothetical protein
MYTMCRLFTNLIFAVALGWIPGGVARADIIFSAELPDVQSSTMPGLITETFNGFPTGPFTTRNTAVGTLTSPGAAIVAADIFGGAGGSRYVAIGAQSGQTQMTLSLPGAQSYFGFWWSAVDAGNSLEFLSGGSVIKTYDRNSAFGSLPNTYLGNPNNGGDSGEKFAYFNFVGTNGTTFDQVRFKNVDTTTGFEADNFSIRAVPAPPAVVLVGMGTGVVAMRRYIGRRRVTA